MCHPVPVLHTATATGTWNPQSPPFPVQFPAPTPIPVVPTPFQFFLLLLLSLLAALAHHNCRHNSIPCLTPCQRRVHDPFVSEPTSPSILHWHRPLLFTNTTSRSGSPRAAPNTPPVIVQLLWSPLKAVSIRVGITGLELPGSPYHSYNGFEGKLPPIPQFASTQFIPFQFLLPFGRHMN